MNEIIQKAVDEARMSCAGALTRAHSSSTKGLADKVVFSNFHGAGYGCNPKYIAEALLRLADRPLDLVWLARQRDTTMSACIRHVQWGSPAAAWEWATARVWVDNVRTRRHVAKKPGQLYLQTWHGCLFPKRIEAAAEHILSRTYIRGAKQDSRDTDCFLCNNDLFEKMLRTAFWYDGPIARCGLPRNAALINSCDDVRERVRQKLGVPDGTHICLYAPTFRDRAGARLPDIDCSACCQALTERFDAPFVWVVRLHPNVAASMPRIMPKEAIDASGYGDAIELLNAADVLITDYSSMAEDFALLGRPGYQYVPDAHEFALVRGLVYPLELRPFPLARTQQELLDVIRNTEDSEFCKRRERFFASVGFDDDGRGDEAVACAILDVLEK